eukprot:PhF_6_TR33023/c0_g1_i2/m.48672
MVKIQFSSKRPREHDVSTSTELPILPSPSHPDIPIEDNILISEFPSLRTCGDMIHGEAGTRVDTEGSCNAKIGMDCCGVCARKPDERFRCKVCKRIVYCSTSHLATDRAFHNTVCDALATVQKDEEADVPTSTVGNFASQLLVHSIPSSIPKIDLSSLSLSEVWSRYFVRGTPQECKAFLFGTPLGRRVMEYMTFPLTLWGVWEHNVPKGRNHVVHVVGAARGECEFPMLWDVVFPQSTYKAMLFFGPQVPKSLHHARVNRRMQFYRNLYHEDPRAVATLPPTVVFAPSMGLTTGKYDWSNSLALFQAAFRPGTIVVTTAGNEEEMEREIDLLRKTLKWTVVEGYPKLNPYASTMIRQSTTMANDVYRSCYTVCVYVVREA